MILTDLMWIDIPGSHQIFFLYEWILLCMTYLSTKISDEQKTWIRLMNFSRNLNMFKDLNYSLNARF